MDSGLLGVATGVAAAAGFMGYAVRGRSSRVFGESFYHGDRSRPVLALTFDDGPSEATPKLLDALDRFRVPATFFMCGANVRRCPGVAREVAARGHELGNHTDSHPRLDFKSPRFIYREIAQAQTAIQETTGLAPRWFRAPYGVRWFGVAQAQQLLGLRGVMWTVIGRDWKWPSERVSGLLLNTAANGGIICLHDGRGVRPSPDIQATIQAVEFALPRLQERGFRFLTLSQTLCPTN
ncbi:MAG TPA: polysaccharide deacetylase family protein [Bryobacteraceae bacterium]|nr:polysaccharide deacetylase family protein [Bryobacteraceae bacterium]